MHVRPGCAMFSYLPQRSMILTEPVSTVVQHTILARALCGDRGGGAARGRGKGG